VAGSIGGGGFLNNVATAGKYGNATGVTSNYLASGGTNAAATKTNFGLNLKFNKQLTNLQGNVNIITRSNGRVYQFKSNAIDSLTIQIIPVGDADYSSLFPNSYRATFTSKANVTDISDPLNILSLGGNKALQIKIIDRGEPGSNDKIAITLNEPSNQGGGLLFSSNWSGTKSLDQVIGGGNIQVRPAQLLDGPAGPGAPTGSVVTVEQVQAIVPAAIARWRAAGIASDRLAALASQHIIVDDLASGELGWQNADTIAIDSDASGYGWFADPTPDDDSEFAGGVAMGAAVDRVDLLTVVMHEMGHVLGYFEDDTVANTIMSEGLAPGVRRHLDASGSASSLCASGTSGQCEQLSLSVDNVFQLGAEPNRLPAATLANVRVPATHAVDAVFDGWSAEQLEDLLVVSSLRKLRPTESSALRPDDADEQGSFWGIID
jgi:hypothetical protein